MTGVSAGKRRRNTTRGARSERLEERSARMQTIVAAVASVRNALIAAQEEVDLVAVGLSHLHGGGERDQYRVFLREALDPILKSGAPAVREALPILREALPALLASHDQRALIDEFVARIDQAIRWASGT